MRGYTAADVGQVKNIVLRCHHRNERREPALVLPTEINDIALVPASPKCDAELQKLGDAIGTGSQRRHDAALTAALFEPYGRHVSDK